MGFICIKIYPMAHIIKVNIMTKIEFKHIRPLQPAEQQNDKDHLSTRYIKRDLDGNELPFSATQWATITDKLTHLMWANNWNADDTFPIAQVTWHESSDIYCQEHHEATWNNGYNTENWLATINHHGWATHHDWRIPSIEELRTLLLKSRIAGKVQFDVQRYNQLFTDEHENKFFWSSTNYAEFSPYAWGIYFFNGHDSNSNKTNGYYIRAVRNVISSIY